MSVGRRQRGTSKHPGDPAQASCTHELASDTHTPGLPLQASGWAIRAACRATDRRRGGLPLPPLPPGPQVAAHSSVLSALRRLRALCSCWNTQNGACCAKSTTSCAAGRVHTCKDAQRHRRRRLSKINRKKQGGCPVVNGKSRLLGMAGGRAPANEPTGPQTDCNSPTRRTRRPARPSPSLSPPVSENTRFRLTSRQAWAGASPEWSI